MRHPFYHVPSIKLKPKPKKLNDIHLQQTINNNFIIKDYRLHKTNNGIIKLIAYFMEA